MIMKPWIYKKGKWVRASGFDLFIRNILHFFKKWKIINTDKYWLVLSSDIKKHFVLSDVEYNKAKNIYKDKGTISYEFYPCAGIAWGVKIHVWKTDEVIDISDVGSW